MYAYVSYVDDVRYENYTHANDIEIGFSKLAMVLSGIVG